MTTWSLTADCTNARAQAEFWKLALGYVDAPPPGEFASWDEWLRFYDVPEDEWDDGATIVDPDGLLPRICFLRVPEPKTAKNRLHLDVYVAGSRDEVPNDVRVPLITAHVAMLVAAGGTVLRENVIHGRLDGVVMADPEGHEFCVA